MSDAVMVNNGTLVMSTAGDAAPKKHRHDLGQEDHGPVMAAGTTKAIQMVLGLWIALTALALLWAMIDAG